MTFDREVKQEVTEVTEKNTPGISLFFEADGDYLGSGELFYP
jgi:hypothetical protein